MGRKNEILTSILSHELCKNVGEVSNSVSFKSTSVRKRSKCSFN